MSFKRMKILFQMQAELRSIPGVTIRATVSSTMRYGAATERQGTAGSFPAED